MNFPNTVSPVLQPIIAFISVSTTGTNVRFQAFLLDVQGNVLSDGNGTYHWIYENDDGTSSKAALTGRIFPLPNLDHSARPFLRLSVANYGVFVSNVFRAGTALSAREQIAGINSAIDRATVVLPVTGGGITPGSPREVDTSQLRDLFGRTVFVDALDYQWQTNDGAGGAFSNISGATSKTYVLNIDDFNNDNRYLRAQVTDGAVLGVPPAVFTSAIENIDRQPIDANVAIQIEPNSDGLRYAPGAELNANVSNQSDPNNNNNPGDFSEYRHEWLVRPESGDDTTFRVLTLFINGPSNPNSTYTLKTEDFQATDGSPIVQLRLTLVDAFGFVSDASFDASVPILQVTTRGTANSESDGVGGGDIVTVNISRLIDINEIGTFAYQWQGAPAGGTWEDITGGGDGNYTLALGTWNTNHVSVRASVVHTDGINGLFTLTAAPLQIAEDTTGDPFLRIGGNISPAAGATVEVITVSVADANTKDGQGSYTYEWQEMGGASKSETGRSYILQAADITNLRNGTPLRVSVEYTDGLGYTTDWFVTLNFPFITLGRSGHTLMVNVEDPAGFIRSGPTFIWERSATENGAYTPYTAAGVNNVYVVPTTYDAAFPFMRARVSYQALNGANFINTNPIRVAGIVSGEGTLVSTGIVVGSEWSVDIANFLDVLDRVPGAGQLGYQWQTGTSQIGDYTNIPAAQGGTNATYRLPAGGFLHGREWLRVTLTDPAQHSGSFTPIVPGALIESLPTGELALTLTRDDDRLLYSISSTLGLVLDNITDLNGYSPNSVTVGWASRNGGSGAYGVIANEDGNNYLVQRADFPDGGSPVFRASVMVRDDLGFFKGPFYATLEFVQDPSTGPITVQGNAFRPAATLTLDTTDVVDPNGVGAFTYQWQSSPSRAAATGWSDIATNAQGEKYEFANKGGSGQWNGAHPYIRAAVVHTDNIGGTTALTSAARLVNQPTQGQPRVVVSLVGVGEGVSVNVNQISDANNAPSSNGDGGDYTYQWKHNDGSDIASATGQTYNLVLADVTSINNGDPLRVSVELTDDLNFTHSWELFVQVLEVQIGIDTAERQVTSNILDPQNIADSSSYTYHWLNSPDISGPYVAISGAPTSQNFLNIGVDYDVTRPFVQLSLDYNLKSGGGSGRAQSSGLRAAGIRAGGTVGITPPTPSAFTVGATYQTDLSGLFDIYNRPLPITYVTYSWESGDSTTFTGVAAGTGNNASYVLALTDFSAQNQFLRVTLTDLSKSSGVVGLISDSGLISPPFNIQRVATANYTLSLVQAAANNVPLGNDAQYALRFLDFEDLNEETINNPETRTHFTWEAYYPGGAINTVIDNALGSNAYTINVADFGTANSQRPQLRVQPRYVDVFGFTNTMTPFVYTIPDIPPSGQVRLEPDTDQVTADIVFTANIDNVRDDNGISVSTYLWEAGRTSDLSNGDWTSPVPGIGTAPSQGQMFTVSATWSTTYVSLRVRYEITDDFGVKSTHYAMRQIAYPPDGAPLLTVIDNGDLSKTGTTVGVDVSRITDNNGSQFTYQWQENNGANKAAAATGSTYIITADDVTAINDNTPPRVSVLHTDSLGFETSWLLTVEVVRVEISLVGASVIASLVDARNLAAADSLRYHWVQSETENGTYAPIPNAPAASTNSTVYLVPVDYDVTKPWVRVSLDYERVAGRLASRAISTPLRVAGVASGEMRISGSSGAPDALYEADVSNLINVVGRQMRLQDFTYQWQIGDVAGSTTGGGNYNDVVDAGDASVGTIASYELRPADFNNANRFLRVRGVDRATGMQLFAVGANVQKETEVSASVTVFANAEGQRNAPGVTLSLTVTSVVDENVTGTITYAWEARTGGGSYRQVAAASTAGNVYATQQDDASGQLPEYRVIVAHTDSFGFVNNPLYFTLSFENTPVVGAARVIATTYYPNSEFSVNVSSISDDNGENTFDNYAWFAAEDGGNWNDLGVSTSEYTLQSSWNTLYVSLRAELRHTDPYGNNTALTASSVRIAQPTQGRPLMRVVNNAQVATGVTASVDISNLRDANDNPPSFSGQASYQWLTKDGNVIASADDQTYTLTADDVRDINANTPPRVSVTWQDSLGFETSWLLTVEVVRVDISLVGASVIASLVDARNLAAADSLRYHWVQSETENGTYAPIPNAPAASTNSTVYFVPVDYDVTKPWVQVSVDYERVAGRLASRAISTPLRVAGVASGEMRISGSSGAPDALYEADVSNLINVVGRQMRLQDFTFQWQIGDVAGATTGGGNYNDVVDADAANVTTASYELRPADFNNANRFLRVRGVDRATGMQLWAVGANVQRETEVSASVTVFANAQGQR